MQLLNLRHEWVSTLLFAVQSVSPHQWSGQFATLSIWVRHRQTPVLQNLRHQEFLSSPGLYTGGEHQRQLPESRNDRRDADCSSVQRSRMGKDFSGKRLPATRRLIPLHHFRGCVAKYTGNICMASKLVFIKRHDIMHGRALQQIHDPLL